MVRINLNLSILKFRSKRRKGKPITHRNLASRIHNFIHIWILYFHHSISKLKYNIQKSSIINTNLEPGRFSQIRRYNLGKLFFNFQIRT